MKFDSILLPQDTVSVHRPGFYAHRFLDFCADRVFKKIPSREYCKAAARISNSSSETSPFICVFSSPLPSRPEPDPFMSFMCRTNGLSHSYSIEGDTYVYSSVVASFIALKPGSFEQMLP